MKIDDRPGAERVPLIVTSPVQPRVNHYAGLASGIVIFVNLLQKWSKNPSDCGHLTGHSPCSTSSRMKPSKFARLTSLTLAASLASSPAFAAGSVALDDSKPRQPVQMRPKHPGSLGALLGKPDQPMVPGDAKEPGVLGRIRRKIADGQAKRAQNAAEIEASYGNALDPRLGKIVRGATGPDGGRVLFNGDRSELRQLPRVMSAGGKTGVMNRGTLNTDGSITWDHAVPTKGPVVADLPDQNGIVQPRREPKFPPPTDLLKDPKGIGYTRSVRRDVPHSTTGTGDPANHRPYSEKLIKNHAYDPKSALKNESLKPSKAAQQEHQVQARIKSDAAPDFDAQTKAIAAGQPLMNTPTVGETREALVKPSQWRKYLRLTPDAATKLGNGAVKQIRSARRGIYNAAFPSNTGSGNALTDATQNMNSLPAASAAFAASLMGAAAYNSYMNPGTNPLAKDQAHDLLHDEVTWIGMTGYILTSNFLMNHAATQSVMMGKGSILKKAPLFGSIIAVSSLVQIGFAEFANDPDVKACISFDNYHKTGSPLRDWDACDRAFASEHLRDIATRVFVDRFLPQAFVMAASGSLFYASMFYAGKLISFEKISARLGALAGSSNVAGIAIKLGIAIAVNTLFQKSIDSTAQQVAEDFAKYRQASFTRQSGTYAATAENAERDLFIAWSKIKADNWNDPSDTSKIAQKDICYDETRVGAKYFKCGSPGVDFEGALATYDAQQSAWRDQALSRTKALHEQWKVKVGTYHALYSYAQKFYKDAVEKIIYTLRNPQAPANDPNVFNLANMNVVTHTRWLPDGARALFYWASFIESFDGAFRFVATPNLNEKLMASLACGPPIEGIPTPNAFTKGVNYLRSWYGDLPPQQMIVNEAGRKVVFSPPRIVDVPAAVNVCDQTVSTAALATWIKSDVSNFEIRTREKTYIGLPAFILDHVSSSVIAGDLAGDPNRLPEWWNDYVMTKDKQVNDELATEYQEVVEKFFKPALVNKEYYYCDVGTATKGSRVEDYLYRIGSNGEACGTNQTHRLANGVLNSLRDQARLYTAMMMDLYISNAAVLGTPQVSNSNAPYARLLNSVLVPARNMMEAYDRFTAQYSTQADPEAMQKSLLELAAAYKTFALVVLPPREVEMVSLKGEPYQREWMRSLGNNLNATLATLTAYVQLASLPRVGGMQ